MRNLSSAWLDPDTRYFARIEWDDGEIASEDIQNFTVTQRAVGSSNDITLGGTPAAELNATIIAGPDLKNKEIRLYLKKGSTEVYNDAAYASTFILGTSLLGQTESNPDPSQTSEIPFGTYIVDSCEKEDNFTTLKAYDKMYSKMEWAYFPSSGLSTAKAVLNDIGDQLGLKVSIADVSDVNVSVYDGFTYREMTGYMAALLGGNAWLSDSGTIRVGWFTDNGQTVEPDQIYNGGFTRDTAPWTLAKLTCNVTTSTTTMDEDGTYDTETETVELVAGSGSYGITFENPWMTQDALNTIWGRIGMFSYKGARLSMFADMRVEAGDILTVTDKDGDVYTVPVMAIQYTYDGGMKMDVSAYAQSDTASSGSVTGPITKQMERYVAEMGVFQDLQAQNFKAVYAQIGTLEVDVLQAVYAEIGTLVADLVQADVGEFGFLTAAEADLRYATIDELYGEYGSITVINSEVANIGSLLSGETWTGTLESINLTTSNATIDYELVANALIQNATIANLLANVIYTDQITIMSEDGGITIVGNQMQFTNGQIIFYDDDGNPRLQIGQDALGNFTFALYAADGSGVMIDENGIKASAISDGLIVDAMVADNAAIQGSKLDIASVAECLSTDGTLTMTASQVKVDEEGLDVYLAKINQDLASLSESEYERYGIYDFQDWFCLVEAEEGAEKSPDPPAPFDDRAYAEVFALGLSVLGRTESSSGWTTEPLEAGENQYLWWVREYLSYDEGAIWGTPICLTDGWARSSTSELYTLFEANEEHVLSIQGEVDKVTEDLYKDGGIVETITATEEHLNTFEQTTEYTLNQISDTLYATDGDFSLMKQNITTLFANDEEIYGSVQNNYDLIAANYEYFYNEIALLKIEDGSIYAGLTNVEGLIEGLNTDGLSNFMPYYAMSDSSEECPSGERYDDRSYAAVFALGISVLGRTESTSEWSPDKPTGAEGINLLNFYESTNVEAVSIKGTMVLRLNAYGRQYAGGQTVVFSCGIKGSGTITVYNCLDSSGRKDSVNVNIDGTMTYTYVLGELVEDPYILIETSDGFTFTEMKLELGDTPTEFNSGMGTRYVWWSWRKIFLDGSVEWSDPQLVTDPYTNVQWAYVYEEIGKITISVGEVQETTTDLTERVGQVEITATYITNTVSEVQKSLDGKADTSYVATQIQQLADSITLTVSGSVGGTASIKMSVNGSSQSGTIDLTKVRTAFANDTTAITISAGEITITGGGVYFNSNTLVVNSDYFTVSASGRIKATRGTIGGWNITDSCIYTGALDGFNYTSDGTYIGSDGIKQQYYGTFFSVQDGKLRFGKGDQYVEETNYWQQWFYDGTLRAEIDAVEDALNVHGCYQIFFGTLSGGNAYIISDSSRYSNATYDHQFYGTVNISGAVSISGALTTTGYINGYSLSDIASDASSAVSTANTAINTANTAASNATTAINTANTAASNATTAINTANTAASNATTAINTANTAASNASAAYERADAAMELASTANGNAITAINRIGQWADYFGYTNGHITVTIDNPIYVYSNGIQVNCNGYKAGLYANYAGTGAGITDGSVFFAYYNPTTKARVFGSSNYPTFIYGDSDDDNSGISIVGDTVRINGSTMTTLQLGTMQDGLTDVYLECVNITHVGGLNNSPSNRGEEVGLYANMVFSSVEVSQGSDRSLKTNIKSLSSREEPPIDGLEPVSYERSDIGDGRTHYGYVAQDVQAVLPEIVDADKDGTLGIRYSEIIPLLHMKINEQSEEILELRSRIEMLETALTG